MVAPLTADQLTVITPAVLAETVTPVGVAGAAYAGALKAKLDRTIATKVVTTVMCRRGERLIMNIQMFSSPDSRSRPRE